MREDVIPEVDVAVIGGGPAGATAARLLTEWGHRAIVLTRPAPSPSLAESIPPSARKLLEHVGWAQVIDRAGFIRSTGNTVLWERESAREGGSAGMRHELYPDGTLGYQVDRAVLNRVLLDEATACGVSMINDVTVTDVSDGRVGFVGASKHGVVARWVLDCSGRSGVVARLGWRKPVAQLRTLAIAAVWERRDGWPLVDPTHTLVASHANGWAWSVPLSETRRQVTVMVDPRLTSIAGQGELAAAYDAELRYVPQLWSDTRQATLCTEPFARDASPYTGEPVLPGALLVGDAASFVDPLSSYGIKKALASAWLAAVVVNTALTDAAMQAPALELYASREKAMYDALEQQRLSLSQTAVRDGTASDFWSVRADSIQESDAPNEDLDVAALRRDRDVQAAFDELKRRGDISLTSGSGLRRVEQPTVEGNRVVMQQRLNVPGVSAYVRHVRNVDLVALVNLAPSVSQVPDLYDVYCRQVSPVPLADFLGALSLLIAKGMLVFA